MPSPVLPPTASSMVPPLMVILVLPAAIEPLPMPAPLSPPWAFTVPLVMLTVVVPKEFAPLPMPAPPCSVCASILALPLMMISV